MTFDNQPLVPKGASVNDASTHVSASSSIRQWIKMAKAAQSLGDRTLMAKLNVQAAYRLVPVHLDNHSLMGFQWRGAPYIDAIRPSFASYNP